MKKCALETLTEMNGLEGTSTENRNLICNGGGFVCSLSDRAFGMKGVNGKLNLKSRDK